MIHWPSIGLSMPRVRIGMGLNESCELIPFLKMMTTLDGPTGFS
jgi:hypothetical protein